MNQQERLQLKHMMATNNVQDYTEEIRKLKHSTLMQIDMERIQELRNQEPDLQRLKNQCMIECSFLFTNYPDLYIRLVKGELDLGMFYKFINTLKKIESGKLDWHEGSYEFSSIARDMYMSSAANADTTLNETAKLEEKIEENSDLDLSISSWKQYKQTKTCHKNTKKLNILNSKSKTKEEEKTNNP